MRFFTLLLCGLLITLTALAQSVAPDAEFYPGQLWVQFDPEATSSIQNDHDKVAIDPFLGIIGVELAQRFGLTSVRKPFHFAKKLHISEVFQLNFTAVGDEERFARELEKLNAVGYAERVPVMRPSFTPNDLGPQSGTNNQWGLWRINAQDAWDITTGSGSGIVVAIVDDAVLVTHPDLIPNLLPGYDVADNDTDPMPNNSAMTHGTHVAGISGAATNNGVGIASIGFGIRILPVKSSNQSEVITDAYAGVIWAADNNADVINMSWGGSGFSNTGQNIITYAYDAGCVNVAAAGNDNTSQIFYPAGYNHVISVASTTTNDAKSGFSNFGNWIDVSAPGSAIRSTYFNSSFTPTYANLQGTSMASPMVAGLAGLVWSVNPEMSADQIIECVVNTTDNISGANPSFPNQLGTGRINAFAAVQCALATVNAPPVASISTPNAVSCPGGLVQYFGGSLGGLPTSYAWSFPGGNPSTSSEQNPVVSYPSVGFYNVTLTVSNEFGNNSLSETGFVEVSTNGIDVVYEQNFESGSLAEMGFTIENPDGANGWGLSQVSGSVNGSIAASINLFNYTATGQRDRLILPALDFSNHANIELDFQHAHRRRAQQFRDSLIVYVSTNNGLNWDRIFAAAESGQGNFATGSILGQNFVPTNGNDWCFGGEIGSGCFTLDLSEYDGQSNVLIRFETYNDNGNNIYLDNIVITGNCQLVEAAPIAGIIAPITSVCVGQPVQLLDQSVNIPTSYTWNIPGASPSSSSAPAPVVTFNAPGTYSVSLIVSNGFGSDQITLINYITVNPSPSLGINETQANICPGEGVNLIVTGADSFSWSPMTGLSSSISGTVTASPNDDITYTVTGNLAGCTAQLQVSIALLEAPDAPSIVADDDVAFVVLDPVDVQGHFSFTPPAAGWGSPALTTITVENELVIARDGNAADSLLCGQTVNGAEIAGRIAVIYRGGCEFSAKALNAQNAGAVGVIIVNNEPGVMMEMGPGTQGVNVTIPIVMVTLETGAYLNAAINAGNASARLGVFNGGQLLICPGEVVELAGPGGWNNLQWNNGSTTPNIVTTGAGSFSVSVINDNGCGTASANILVSAAPQATPVISQNNNTLFAGVTGSSFQWFLNGDPIPGANSSTLTIGENGVYSVTVSNSIGCSASSADFAGLVTGIDEFTSLNIRLYPNPANESIWVESTETLERLLVYATDGRLVFDQHNINASQRLRIDTSNWSSGLYSVVAVIDSKPITRLVNVIH